MTKTTLTDRITYSYDANDRVTLETVTDPEDLPLYSRAYTYDSNGNTLSDGTKTYAYDSKNRLISFTDAADTGIYTYDTAGRRMSKTYGGSTTEYLYCTTCRYAQVLEERDGLGNITAEYYIGNDLISREDDTQELNYLYDGHGSVRKLINHYGGVPATYNYDAYGILLESSGPSSENNDFRYAGEQFDPHLDQYYLRARYYNQNVGRFSSMDTWQGSLRNPLSLNKYNYTESNPVMGIDPSGRDTIIAMMAGVNAWTQHFFGAIPVPTTCVSNCPKYYEGKRVRNEKIEPNAEYLSAKDAEEYTLTWKSVEVKKWEMLSEIYKIKEHCYTFADPYTSQYVNYVKYIGKTDPFTTAFWHNHPLIPLNEEVRFRYQNGTSEIVDGWWIEQNISPFILSEGDINTVLMEGLNGVYMTTLDSRAGYDSTTVYPMVLWVTR